MSDKEKPVLPVTEEHTPFERNDPGKQQPKEPFEPERSRAPGNFEPDQDS